ncbi:16S rRNA methyltransferase GidB [Lactobacillus selangorensis]|uniref:Ribosomal RNA small subunit methyltransferase G n=1 Tax=Lactobacillus selangorensis TaxID=81857 RepID=A0A0R2FR82_9LACO|nr:16S rRNA (guanine(527)-N(7))-methyltransferase RsmG [Lactobacillus selangorensis]KRN27594.1 16S rRNA methyltransferase GidB [Lactobacillus selangorensis]KRN30133.1 16S rRNA methyltransferase GidB [Lactobacillus selangorensis]
MNPLEFKQALAEHDIHLTDQQMKQFHDYYQFLVQENQKMNLTAITAEPEVYLKHFYDSLTPAFYVPEFKDAISICDVGAGAGFPSLPLKIVFPQLQVTIIDSLNKRIKFLNELAQKLDLTGVSFIHSRAEDFGSKRSEHREQYDMVLARAVARLNVLAELCLPLVKKGGQFVALKASHTEEELTDAQYAIQKLGGQVTQDIAFELPETGDQRHILVITKKRQTPKTYPRKAGVPNKKPLVDREV